MQKPGVMVSGTCQDLFKVGSIPATNQPPFSLDRKGGLSAAFGGVARAAANIESESGQGVLCAFLAAVARARGERMRELRSNRLKQALRAGEVQYGTFLSLPDPLAAERVSRVGWDWVLIDMEHGQVDLSTAAMMMAAMPQDENAPTPLVRVPSASHDHIKRALDAGAFGILAPMVMDQAECEMVVAATRYPPAGNRSVAGGRAPVAFGTNAPEYFQKANDEILALIQIEHIDAVERADDILSVPGLDGVFIGPSDLSASMGLPPTLSQTDPAFIDAVRRVQASAGRHHVAAGIMVAGLEDATRWLAEGFTYFGVTSELGFMLAGMTRFLQSARASS